MSILRLEGFLPEMLSYYVKGKRKAPIYTLEMDCPWEINKSLQNREIFIILRLTDNYSMERNNGREKKLEHKSGSDKDSCNHHCADDPYQCLIRNKVSFFLTRIHMGEHCGFIVLNRSSSLYYGQWFPFPWREQAFQCESLLS